jgi:hypothetical protein
LVKNEYIKLDLDGSAKHHVAVSAMERVQRTAGISGLDLEVIKGYII